MKWLDAVKNKMEGTLMKTYGLEFPKVVMFLLKKGETALFSDVTLPINVDLAVSAMQQMWGYNFPQCTGGIASQNILTKYSLGVGGLAALTKRRIGDRFRWD